jgi:hypothetical protein
MKEWFILAFGSALLLGCSGDPQDAPPARGSDEPERPSETAHLPDATEDRGLDAGSDAATTNDAKSRSVMTFFVTSSGNGQDGGNFGGLAGADKRCQQFAAAVGADDHTWHAYLSTNTRYGGEVVHAKDRIGKGPWVNVKGDVVAKTLEGLHRDGLGSAKIFDEKGRPIPDNERGVYTGTARDGTAYLSPGEQVSGTCMNWTYGGDRSVGRTGNGNIEAASTDSYVGTWNSFKESSCKLSNYYMAAGRLYCFAVD